MTDQLKCEHCATVFRIPRGGHVNRRFCGRTCYNDHIRVIAAARKKFPAPEPPDGGYRGIRTDANGLIPGSTGAIPVNYRERER